MTNEPGAPGTKARTLRLTALAAATLLVAAACTASASARPPTGASAPAPSPTAAPSSAAAAATPGADATVALGKRIFETAGGVGCRTCHGADAKGKALDSGANAPNIRGATEQKLRDALAGGAAPMAFLKLRDEEIEAVIKYLGSLDQ